MKWTTEERKGKAGFTNKAKYCLVSLPGRSEKSRMHSLKPFASRRSLSCCSMATPIQKGNEELPSSNVSHRWKILCKGNTSAYHVETQK